MKETIDAIYENGVLRPLAKLSMREGQRIKIVVEEETSGDFAKTDVKKGRRELSELAGCLSSSPRFSADPLATQKELRDEWS